MKKFFLALAAVAMTATPALAHRTGFSHYHDRYGRVVVTQRDYHNRRDLRDRRDYYDDRGYTRAYRDRNGRYRCTRRDGTTGIVVGAALGALLGRTVDTRGDRTLGTLGGAVAGGLAGRAVDRRDCR